MIKLIAADMDGTLIGKDHKISKENQDAIREAQKKGIKFAIATGRHYLDIKPFLEEYNLKCECVALNGAEYIHENGNVLEGIYIDKSKVCDILNVILKDKFSVQIYTDKGYYTTNTKEETLKGIIKRRKTLHPEIKDEEEYIRLAKEDKHFINTKYITDLDEFLNSDIKIGKFITFGDSKEEILTLRKKLEKIDGLAVSSSFPTNIEINDSKATKGAILAKVSEKFDIQKDEVMVLGDGLNDYTMFTEFPNSYAMENAVPEIKEIAKYITDANDKSGVGKAIRKVLEDNN